LGHCTDTHPPVPTKSTHSSSPVLHFSEGSRIGSTGKGLDVVDDSPTLDSLAWPLLDAASPALQPFIPDALLAFASPTPGGYNHRKSSPRGRDSFSRLAPIYPFRFSHHSLVPLQPPSSPSSRPRITVATKITTPYALPRRSRPSHHELLHLETDHLKLFPSRRSHGFIARIPISPGHTSRHLAQVATFPFAPLLDRFHSIAVTGLSPQPWMRITAMAPAAQVKAVDFTRLYCSGHRARMMRAKDTLSVATS
jgi:hypothetical protein